MKLFKRLLKLETQFDVGSEELEPRYCMGELLAMETANNDFKNGRIDKARYDHLIREIDRRGRQNARKGIGQTLQEFLAPIRRRLEIVRQTGSAWKAGAHDGTDERTCTENFRRWWADLGVDVDNPATWPGGK